MDTAWADLEKFATTEGGQPIPTATPPAPPEPPKPKEKTAEPTQPPKPETPKPEAKKPDEKAPQTPPVKPKKPADFLREKLAKVENERDTFRSELEKLKAAKPVEDPEKQMMSQRLKDAAERIKSLEDELRVTDFTKHPDFQREYHQPFLEAYQQGASKAMSLKITDDQGNVRSATQQDFDRLLTMDDDSATDAAREMFGDTKASLVLWHRENVLALNRKMALAAENARKNSSQIIQKRSADQEVRQKARQELWGKFNQEAADKYPQWFKPSEDDPEGNELLKKGFEMADAAFGPTDHMTDEQVVRLHSAVRNQAAGFRRLAHVNRRLVKEIASLKEELEAYQESEPTPGEGAPPGAPVGEADSMEGVLSGLDKLARDVANP